MAARDLPERLLSLQPYSSSLHQEARELVGDEAKHPVNRSNEQRHVGAHTRHVRTSSQQVSDIGQETPDAVEQVNYSSKQSCHSNHPLSSKISRAAIRHLKRGYLPAGACKLPLTSNVETEDSHLMLYHTCAYLSTPVNPCQPPALRESHLSHPETNLYLYSSDFVSFYRYLSKNGTFPLLFSFAIHGHYLTQLINDTCILLFNLA